MLRKAGVHSPAAGLCKCKGLAFHVFSGESLPKNFAVRLAKFMSYRAKVRTYTEIRAVCIAVLLHIQSSNGYIYIMEPFVHDSRRRCMKSAQEVACHHYLECCCLLADWLENYNVLKRTF